MNTSSEVIISAAQRISKLWRAAEWNELQGCFSADIIQVGPHLKELSRGREAAIESYRQFSNGAKLTEYNEGDFRADIWRGVATCVYEWSMTYMAEGELRFSRGTDQFIFQEESSGRWIAIWRYIDFWEDRKA